MSNETKRVPVEHIVQVSGFGVESTSLTQCNYMLVAVTNTGRVVMSMGDREWIDVSPKIPAAAPPADELARLEREIATEAAGIGILPYAHKGVVDLSDVEHESVHRDARYLALRGLVRIKESE